MAHQKIYFCLRQKRISIILIYAHQMAIVMLALVIFFLFDNLREKRSVPLTKQSGTAYFTNSYGALAGVTQWIECQPANQRVAGLIPSHGTCLGCGPGPPGKHTLMFLSLSSPLSKNK